MIACQENRSLDHYYGYAPFIGSYGVPPGWTNPDGHGGAVAPSHLTSATAGSFASPDHDWPHIHAEWDNGKMDGFYIANGQIAMGYYAAADLPYYYALARYFTLCTNFFCSMLGPTNPNRVAMVAGTAGGNTTNNIPNGSLTFPCLFDLLDAYGITW